MKTIELKNYPDIQFIKKVIEIITQAKNKQNEKTHTNQRRYTKQYN